MLSVNPEHPTRNRSPQSQWSSVVVNRQYQELPELQYAAERQQATALLAKRYHWRLNALGERQLRVGDKSIDPLFFGIRVESMSGLRAN